MLTSDGIFHCFEDYKRNSFNLILLGSFEDVDIYSMKRVNVGFRFLSPETQLQVNSNVALCFMCVACYRLIVLNAKQKMV